MSKLSPFTLRIVFVVAGAALAGLSVAFPAYAAAFTAAALALKWPASAEAEAGQ